MYFHGILSTTSCVNPGSVGAWALRAAGCENNGSDMIVGRVKVG
jgi:hypothetical protein